MMIRARRILRDAAVFLIVCGGIVGGGWYMFSHVLHLRVETVTSGSMEPLFVPGSRVIVKVGQQPPVGGVVMFRNVQMHGYTTHVYLGTNANGTLHTWGIANGDPVKNMDNFTPAPKGSDIVGTVVYHTEIFTPSYWKSLRGVGSAILLLTAVGLVLLAWRLWRQEKEEMAALTST